MQKKRKKLLNKLEKATTAYESIKRKYANISDELDAHYLFMIENSEILKDTVWNIKVDSYSSTLQTPNNAKSILDNISDLIDEREYLDIEIENSFRLYTDFTSNNIWFSFYSEKELFNIVKRFKLKIDKQELRSLIKEKSMELFELERLDALLDVV